MIARTPLRVLGSLALLLAVAFALLAIQINTWLKPIPPPAAGSADQVLVTIAAGSSSAAVADLLEKEGLIRNATVFRYWLKLRGYDQKLKAGRYLFRYGMTLEEIAGDLVAGNVYRPTVTVTIPEGLTLEQVARRLADSGVVEYEAFWELAQSTVPAMSGSQPLNVRHALEGYLFPDTYTFDEGVSAEAVLNRMLRRLEEIFTPEMRQRAEELGMSIHEVLTMASLVEREVRVPSERELVAGVMHNRLKKNMLLQIDASVLYALGTHKDQVLLVDLEVDSPYNTYKYPGLPPGPIAAPGKQAIMAVLYPAETDYLYYVAKNDGSGEHYFAKTFDQHQANIRKARQNRAARQGG